MTTVSNVFPLRKAHANWLYDKAAHFRRLAAGAVPYAVAQDLDRLAARYERLALALEDRVRDRAVNPVDKNRSATLR